MTHWHGQSTSYVAGEWRRGAERFAVRDPATGHVVGLAEHADLDQADDAVDAAAAAAEAWRQTPAEDRGALLRAAATLLRERLPDLAELLTRENGKPLREAQGELAVSARTLDWCAEEGRRAYGRTVPTDAGRRAMVWREPVGVTVGISPWNFPASMFIRKIALALAAGCPMIVKPAEQTPLIATELIRLFDHAGCPPGVLGQLTTADPGPLVNRLLADPRVAKVTFTGSTEVGRMLLGNADGRLKSVSLELGGHAPGVVFADADLPAAVEAVVGSKFRNAGQSCTALNRLLLHASIADEFTDLLVKRVGALVVGHGLAERTDVGPLIDQAALAKAQGQVDEAVADGATVLAGGRPLRDDPHARGAFFQPTLLADVTGAMRLCQEEIFAPVLPIRRFDDPDEAIALANDTDYGLAAYLYGRDLGTLWRAAERLSFGVVGVNDPFPVAPELPFGGDKNSGLGREGGSEGIAAYLTTKTVTIRL